MTEHKSDQERETELDKVLQALTDGVQRIKKKTAKAQAARETQGFSKKRLAETPHAGFDVSQLKKTQMVFMAMAEESLEDSTDTSDVVDQAPKRGAVTKIDDAVRRLRSMIHPTRPHPRPLSGS